MGYYETNPIMRNVSNLEMLGIKAASTAITIYSVRWISKENPKRAKAVLTGITIFTGLVVTNNLSLTLKL